MFASNPWWIQEMVVCIWPEFIYMHCAQRTEQNKIKKIAKITKLLQFHGLVHFIFYPIHSIIFLVFRELSVFLPSVSKMVAGKIWKSKSKWSRYWLLSPSASVSRYYLVIVTSYCCYFFFLLTAAATTPAKMMVAKRKMWFVYVKMGIIRLCIWI